MFQNPLHHIHLHKVSINSYSFYTLTYYEKENILLYVIPGYDKSYTIKDIPDGTTIFIGNSQECDIIYDTPLTSYTAQRLTQEEIKEMIDNWRQNND